MTTRDRRSSQRIPLEMWVEETSDQGRYFNRSGNLSRGGLHLDRSIPMPVGTEVVLSFTLPGQNETVEVTGEIVSAGNGEMLGMGVKFVGVRPEIQELIDQYLQRARPEPQL